MRYCPKCNSEYQDWVKNCIDCGTELTDRPPTLQPVPKRVSEKLITIATFSYPEEAYLNRAKLESNGIWSFVADDHMVTANWLYSTAVNGVKFQVRESDAHEALTILKGSEEKFSESIGLESETCPKCHSKNIHFEKFRTRPVFIVWLFTLLINPEGGFTLPILKNKWKCKNCGYEWKDNNR